MIDSYRVGGVDNSKRSPKGLVKIECDEDRVFHFLKEPALGEHEREAQDKGYEYINKLEIADGQIYQGYLKGGLRHGPGI